MPENPIDEILQFWFEDIEKSCWFKKDPEFDRELDEKFGALLVQAKNNELDEWCESPRGRLALIILLDQFSRNIFRDSATAFAADAKARQLALAGLEVACDTDLSQEQRSFFYLPFRHAEDLAMQELGLLKTRELNDEGYGSDRYAVGHLKTIERFGRFPHRNAALGRSNTAEEDEYLKDGKGGY